MTFDYSSVLSIAETLLVEYGRDITLVSVNPGTYDAQSDTTIGGSESQTTVKAVVTDFVLSQIDGTIILRGDKLVIISGQSSIIPSVNDKLKIDSKTYRIISVENITPGGASIIYKLQVRQ